MRIASLALAIVLAAAVSDAGAQSGEALLKKHGCTACHDVDKKLIGPAYKEVADKYRGDAGAPAKLAAKVKHGGSGVWGQVPMPPNPQIPDADLNHMISFILSRK
jgi:cytochrome c